MSINSFTRNYEFLSNFYPCDIYVEGTSYPSVEYAFQALKTTNLNERASILLCDTPSKVKAKGRIVTLRPNWEELKVSIMLELVRLKFSNPYLAQKLLETGDEELIEGNA